MKIGILHPGSMGAEVGAALVACGHDVLWCAAGRSAETLARAERAGLTAIDSLAGLAAQVQVALSVCPPAAALEVAEVVVAAGFCGLYVDANATSPQTARRVAACVEQGDARFVDGSLVGPPPREEGSTRLYLSGSAAAEAAEPFSGSRLEPQVVGDEVGAASALKMAYAAWTKGSAALLLTARALAGAAGVEQALLDEWARSIPELPERSQRVAARIPAKAWRFVGEMEEIAATLRELGLPDGFHQAAAEAYRRIAPLRGREDDPDATLEALRGP